MTGTIGAFKARRFPRLDFYSQIASSGKALWPIRFNAEAPKMPIVDDPIKGPARRVIDMTILEEWGGGGATLNNPRGQLQAPSVLYRGAMLWVSFGVLIPAGMPMPTSPIQWNSVFQVHGLSDTGYPSVRIAFEGDGGFGWKRQPSKGENWACSIEPQFDRWMDFAFALHMHTDPALGWVEIWTNFGSGWQQRPLVASAGDTLVGNRLYTETLTAGFVESSRWATHIQNYRKAGYAESTTVFHTDHRQVPMVDYASEAASLVGGTFTAVDPKSY